MFTGSFSLIGMGFIGSDFAPQGDQGQFVIKLELPREATLQHTNQITLKAENIVRSSRIVQNVFTTVGAADGGQAQARLSEIRVKLIPHNKRSVSAKDFAGSLKLELERTLPGTTISLGMTDMMGNIDESPVQYYIVGQNVDSVRIAANEILSEIKNINGIMGPQISSKDGDPQISIVVNRDKIAHLGVSLENLGQTLNLAFNGNTDGKFLRGDMEYDINMKLDKSDRTHIGNIENLSLLNNGGKLILLKQFADIIETEGPKVLERRDRMPSVMISSQIAGRPLGDIGADINKAIENMHLSDQIEVIPGGELEMQDESSGSLGLALIISIFLVYAIMVLLYDSFVYPLVILASLPLAVTGALLALALTMETLNIFTMLGLVVLIGLVAKNAILLVDYTNHLKSKGVPLQEALINATNQRFRPIVMTTLAMVIGMLPVALATGAAAEWKNGLGWVIIGGLISSLFLTLIVVPLLYYIMERIMIRIGLNKHKEIVLVENEI
jgi:HAE1 family hydrophobic/amphiphilic exporter-1